MQYDIWFTLTLLALVPLSILACLAPGPPPPRRHQLRQPD